MVAKDMAVAFLFPGQGAQYQGMALDFLKAGGELRALFALASDIMGQDMKDLLENAGDETLKRTDVSQPVITLANLAAAAFLKERGLSPAGCAGFSLGEYAALVVSAVISLEDCFRLVKARGRVMQESVDSIKAESAKKNPGAAPDTVEPGMAAVIGLSPSQVETLIAQWTAEGLTGLYGANFNSPRQVVVAGTAEALAEAQERFKAAGARRVLRLPVAGPFHSPLIAGAAEKFAPFLEKVSFKDPAIPLYSNVSGKPVRTGAEARELALKQITNPVRWIEEEEAIAASGIGAVVETGPGKVLQGLWKETGSALPCYAAGTVEAAEEFLKVEP
ncbi:MAG: ACP S-malonyltransferase [Treponema sp.]|jgi:[acyl-carrier-protein] S-malonyltransferase|nr:ACP S-malonyltransferase [Treponema sp.]